jgi:hypothetical protein
VTFHELLSGQPRKQIADLSREMLCRAIGQRVQRERSTSVRTGRPPQTEIDPARGNRFQNAELLCDLERRVVWQHHARSPDADPAGGGGNRADQDFGGSSGLAVAVVVLGTPVTMIAKRLAIPRQRQALADRGIRRAATHHG